MKTNRSVRRTIASHASRIEGSQMTERPVVIAVASYRSSAAAHSDFHAVEEAARFSGSCHLALAVVEKGADGGLTIDRYLCSEAGPAWDGAVLGGALAVIAPPIGMSF